MPDGASLPVVPGAAPFAPSLDSPARLPLAPADDFVPDGPRLRGPLAGVPSPRAASFGGVDFARHFASSATTSRSRAVVAASPRLASTSAGAASSSAINASRALSSSRRTIASRVRASATSLA